MPPPSIPLRQIHLDFHTSPHIPDVGADWDAEHFAHTLKRAQVQSVTLFAKCHHGLSYYPTRVGQMHPALQFDLLGEQLRACHAAGLRAPIYLSVVWDTRAAAQHPEWRQVTTAGTLLGGPLDNSWWNWPWLCVNSGYADELIAQTEELLERYPCDGFFYDILMYHPDSCVCVNCLAEMRRGGLDPHSAEHRRVHANTIARRFMERASATVRAQQPAASIFYNSRWGLHFAEEAAHYSQIEIESLATGGWGYGFYPLWSRYGRTFGLPMLGMTGRFHRSWGDWGGLKHPDALRFECGGILATGGAISIGDQLHPRGRLNEAVYDVIGAAFADVAAVEPYCVQAQGVAQIGVLAIDAAADRVDGRSADGPLEGAARMLLELHQQFDVITPQTCVDFSVYDMLVIPDRGSPTPALAERLRAFVVNGGRLLLSHHALFDEGAGAFVLQELLGIAYQGPTESVPDYFQIVNPALHGPVTRPGFAYSLYEGPCVRVAPGADTLVLAEAYPTYFNRTWQHYSSHGFTPPAPESAGYPAITQAGPVIYCYGPIFTAYQQHGNLTFRDLLGRCIDRLLPVPLLATTAPASAEVTLMRQGERQIVHIVNYHAGRRAPGHVEVLEAPVPLRDVQIQLRRSAPTERVFLAHTQTPLAFTVAGDQVLVLVPRVDTHALVVFEG